MQPSISVTNSNNNNKNTTRTPQQQPLTSTMEDAQNRRRRPVTYGKPTRKRLSDIDEIFSLPSVIVRSPIPSLPSAPITRKEKGGAKATAKPKNNSNSTSNNNSSDFQYKKRSAPKVLNPNSSDPAAPKPRATTDSDSPASDEDLYEIEGQSDEAAAAQLINEERLSRGDELRVFDVPSSDNDEDELSAPRPTLKRKRVPSVPPKPASKPKEKMTADKSPLDSITVAEAENMFAKSKRSRLPARTKPEEPVAGLANKLTTAGKITKPIGRSSSMKGKEKVAGQQQPSTRRSVSVEPSGDRVTAPSRNRVTRSQSRQLSEEPLEIEMRPIIFEESRRHPAHMHKIEVVIPSSPKQTRKQEVKKCPKPLAEKNLKVIPEEKPSENTATAKIAKKRVVEKTQTAVRSKVEAPVNNIQDEEPFGLFAYDLSPMVQPRKRLIDVLGAAQVGPRKKSCSPSASDVNSQEYGSGSQSETQSQEDPESYDASSQEVTIMNVQRQRFGNGRAGPRVTYARERSYRTEEPAACSLEDMLSMPLPSIKPMQPARRRLEQLKPPDDDTESVGSKSKSMIKSIHELRAAGEHSRFIDDVEDLFLDIEGTCPLGTKRSGYFELTNRLRDKTFNQKFRTNSFDERLLTKMDLQTDEIITFILSYLTLCFLQEDFTPRTMLRVCKHGIMPMLARMLASTRDVSVIAKDRKTNLSKAAQSQVSDLRAYVEKCPVFLSENVKVISPQILALKVLDWLVRRSREHGSSDEILSKNALRGLVEILCPFSTSKEYPKSLQTHGFQLLELPISTLEAYTMGGYGSLEAQISNDELLSLARLFTVASSWTCEVNLGPILLLLLRLNINITNNRSSACEKLSDSSLIASLVALIKNKFDALSGTLEEQERLLSVDLLVLSLGLMMNLAEFSPRARSVVGVQVVPSVEGSPIAIDILLDIFLDRLERAAEADSMEESHTNVAFGYLAVLLGDLCQEDHIRYKARGRLPNSNLKSLQGAIEEFIAHHRKVDEHMFGVEEDDSPGPQAEFTARLQDVMVRLRAYA
ncbi:wings apart-like protein regulation of heterochromatin-domain-containing protein [Trichophaea hybrida]|nr:wings apart-like protein regulation of heterochromatin-domain-containing protein [Trichophaea hybrida]